MIYFSWISHAHEVFSPKIHAQHDVPIVFLSLKQEEGEAATLIMHVPLDTPIQNYGILSYQDAAMFKGYVEHVYQEEGLSKIHFKAIQQEQSWLNLAYQMKGQETFCSEFFDDQETHWKNVLCDQPYVPYWCPYSGVCRLSHIIHETSVFNAKAEPIIVTGSKQLPGISRIRIQVYAQWIQQVQGLVDVFPWIERHFPGRVIATYSPKNLKKIWPKTGALLGNSGYRIVHSELTLNERKSSIVKLESGKRLVQRSVFDGSLWVFWNFKQKRKEYVETEWSSEIPGESVTVRWNLGKVTSPNAIDFWSPHRAYLKGECVRFGQKIFESKQDHHSVVFREPEDWGVHTEHTNALFLTTQSSLFATSFGKKAVQFALQRAYIVWLKAARCRQVEIKGTLESLGGITLHHQIHVQHPQWGDFSGKVTRYTLTIEDGISVISVRAEAVHPTAFLQKHYSLNSDNSFPYARGYADDWYTIPGKTEGSKNSEYFTYDEARPLDQYRYVPFFAGNQLLDRIQVTFSDEDQREYLEQQSVIHIKKFIPTTSIKIHFHKLKGLESLKHKIPVQMKYSLAFSPDMMIS